MSESRSDSTMFIAISAHESGGAPQGVVSQLCAPQRFRDVNPDCLPRSEFEYIC